MHGVGDSALDLMGMSQEAFWEKFSAGNAIGAVGVHVRAGNAEVRKVAMKVDVLAEAVEKDLRGVGNVVDEMYSMMKKQSGNGGGGDTKETRQRMEEMMKIAEEDDEEKKALSAKLEEAVKEQDKLSEGMLKWQDDVAQENKKHEEEMREMVKAAKENEKEKSGMKKELKEVNDRCKKQQGELERLRSEKKEHTKKATGAIEASKDQTARLQKEEKERNKLKQLLEAKEKELDDLRTVHKATQVKAEKEGAAAVRKLECALKEKSDAVKEKSDAEKERDAVKAIKNEMIKKVNGMQRRLDEEGVKAENKKRGTRSPAATPASSPVQKKMAVAKKESDTESEMEVDELEKRREEESEKRRREDRPDKSPGGSPVAKKRTVVEGQTGQAGQAGHKERMEQAGQEGQDGMIKGGKGDGREMYEEDGGGQPSANWEDFVQLDIGEQQDKEAGGGVSTA